MEHRQKQLHKVVVFNDIHVGAALEYAGVMRANSPIAEERLSALLQTAVVQHQPDLVINLGDLIRSHSRENDLEHYSRALTHFGQVACPVVHLLGNHELKQMSEGDISAIWQQQDIQQQSFGSMQLGAFQCLWLGLELYDNKPYVPAEQIAWLRDTLGTNTRPVLIWLHCPIDEHNVNGSFFHNYPGPQSFFLANQLQVRQVITAHPHVQAVFQAHVHHFHVKILDRVPYITLPAMGDNICAPDFPANFPEVYTVVTVSTQHLDVKCYAREYCFAGFEWSLGSHSF